MEVAPEVIADRYRLDGLLGRGGMGEVRLGHDERLGRPVAVKLLHHSMAADEGARRRFEDEARAAAQLVHPNAVAVFDTGEHEGIPYIVMECLPGRTLADEIAEGPMPAPRVRAVALQVLSALEAAHRAGVIHRDVKPGNILLTADGTAKVGDFGIAKTAEGLDHTATGMIVGTPSYLAPERITGSPATARSDLYAVGVVLYEALAGAKPFHDRSPLALAAALQHEAPRPLGALAPGADAALVAATERAMARDPADRFASASSMGAAIDGELPGATDAAGVGATEAVSPPVTVPAGRPAASTAPVEAPPGGTAVAAASRRRSGAGAGRGAWRRRVPVAAALVLVALLVASVLLAAGPDGEGADGSGPVPTDRPGGPALPPALEEPVRALEEAVQP